MPTPNQPIGATAPKSGTFQRDVHRLQGVPLKIPAAAGVSSVSNNRIVSLQVDANNIMYAVISPVAIASHTVIGWGVLEEALQSQGIDSISPSPNTFKDGDTVTVLRYPMQVMQIDYDASNAPTEGIATAYLDVQGRLSSSSAGSNLALKGAVFSCNPSMEMSNQLKSGCLYYQMESPVVP